jgi:PKD repeat protein
MRKSILYPAIIIFIFLLLGRAYGESKTSTNGAALWATATIYADETEVCLGESIEATINFAGDGPWDIKVNDNDGTILDLKDVEESTITIWLEPLEDNRYYIKEVKDRRGRKGQKFGEVVVTVLESIPVFIQLDKTAYLDSDPGVELVSTPSGGVFSGNGVSGNFFYPYIATAVGSPHRITCTYSISASCVSTDQIDIHVLYGEGEVQLFSGNDVVTALCDDGATYEIRGSNMDNIPGLFELRQAGSTVPVPGHISDANQKDDMAILDPAGLTGSYDIVYTYSFQDLTIPKYFRFQMIDMGIIEIPGLPDVVCKSDDPYVLVPDLANPDPGDVYQFSGPGVTGNQADGFYYDPGDPGAPEGENQIELVYTTSDGCAFSMTRVVTNMIAPDVKFSLDPACLSEDGSIVNFKNLTEKKDAVDNWSWVFGDPASGANNYSSEENPSHFYAEDGSRHITLTATTSNGCVSIGTVDTVLAKRPVADFSWISDCFVEGQMIAFVNRSLSPFSPLDTLIWTFTSMDDGVLGVIGSNATTDTVEFSFPTMDQYIIDLQVRNEVGCSGNATKEITLHPITTVTAAGYEENFNGARTDWYSGSDSLDLSWIRYEPDFNGFNQVPGDWAWFTNLPPDNSGYLEHSWIQSGCFDFSSRKSAFIQLDLMKSFNPGVDGALLQYQDVVSEGWKTIGDVGTGINWYNVTGLTNKPGGSNFGWGLDQFIPDTDWINASHGLDMVAGLSRVKFRIAIATGGSKEIESGRYNQGFAFDNIFIGERVKRSLLEHFTNSASFECWNADDVVDQFALNHSSSVIDLQYHMDYPGVDPMNANNPYAPSARDLYGVKGVGVPYAVLNGGTIPDHRFDFSDPSNEPNEEVLQQASLEVPVFDFDLNVNWMENRVEVNTLATCKTDTFDSNVDLYVVLIESSVTAYPGLNGDTIFRNVVLDILPSPAGKLLGNEWYNGKTDTRNYSWDYAEYVEDIEELAVVAFLQDRDNNWKVLQVATDYLTPLVGKPTWLNETRPMAIYPNPAVELLYVNLGTRQVNQGTLKIMDLSGKEVMTVNVRPGVSLYQLDVGRLSRGMYLIYWMESGKMRGRKKLVFTR